MWNSTTPKTPLHKSIALEFLNDMHRKPHLPFGSPFVSILSLPRISANDRQAAESESNSEVKLFPPMKMKTSTVACRSYKNDVSRRQRDNHSAQPQISHKSLAIRYF